VAKRRDQRLSELYWRHSVDALRLAFLLTGDQHAAEDIVQDAFVRLLGRFHELRSPDAFETYLRRTVINLSRDRFRRIRLERDQAAKAPTVPPQRGTAAQVEDRELIRSALRNLPQRQRAALVLRFYVDLSEQQTAEVLECSVPAVKSLLTRATAALKATMRGDEA
jgi:RNA polymerase sigma-70 factor (sigma-E family)